MKKLLILCLVLILGIAFTGCIDDDNDSSFFGLFFSWLRNDPIEDDPIVTYSEIKTIPVYENRFYLNGDVPTGAEYLDVYMCSFDYYENGIKKSDKSYVDLNYPHCYDNPYTFDNGYVVVSKQNVGRSTDYLDYSIWFNYNFSYYSCDYNNALSWVDNTVTADINDYARFVWGYNEHYCRLCYLFILQPFDTDIKLNLYSNVPDETAFYELIIKYDE